MDDNSAQNDDNRDNTDNNDSSELLEGGYLMITIQEGVNSHAQIDNNSSHADNNLVQENSIVLNASTEPTDNSATQDNSSEERVYNLFDRFSYGNGNIMLHNVTYEQGYAADDDSSDEELSNDMPVVGEGDFRTHYRRPRLRSAGLNVLHDINSRQHMSSLFSVQEQEPAPPTVEEPLIGPAEEAPANGNVPRRISVINIAAQCADELSENVTREEEEPVDLTVPRLAADTSEEGIQTETGDTHVLLSVQNVRSCSLTNEHRDELVGTGLVMGALSGASAAAEEEEPTGAQRTGRYETQGGSSRTTISSSVFHSDESFLADDEGSSGQRPGAWRRGSAVVGAARTRPLTTEPRRSEPVRVRPRKKRTLYTSTCSLPMRLRRRFF